MIGIRRRQITGDQFLTLTLPTAAARAQSRRAVPSPCFRPRAPVRINGRSHPSPDRGRSSVLLCVAVVGQRLFPVGMGGQRCSAAVSADRWIEVTRSALCLFRSCKLQLRMQCSPAPAPAGRRPWLLFQPAAMQPHFDMAGRHWQVLNTPESALCFSVLLATGSSVLSRPEYVSFWPPAALYSALSVLSVKSTWL